MGSSSSKANPNRATTTAAEVEDAGRVPQPVEVRPRTELPDFLAPLEDELIDRVLLFLERREIGSLSQTRVNRLTTQAALEFSRREAAEASVSKRLETYAQTLHGALSTGSRIDELQLLKWQRLMQPQGSQDTSWAPLLVRCSVEEQHRNFVLLTTLNACCSALGAGEQVDVLAILGLITSLAGDTSFNAFQNLLCMWFWDQVPSGTKQIVISQSSLSSIPDATQQISRCFERSADIELHRRYHQHRTHRDFARLRAPFRHADFAELCADALGAGNFTEIHVPILRELGTAVVRHLWLPVCSIAQTDIEMYMEAAAIEFNERARCQDSMACESAGSKGAALRRSFSAKSLARLAVLGDIQSKLDFINSLVQRSESMFRELLSDSTPALPLSAENPLGSAILSASSELRGSRLSMVSDALAQCYGRLEALQDRHIDSVITGDLESGRAEAKRLRKQLTRDTSALMKRVTQLRQQVVASREVAQSQ